MKISRKSWHYRLYNFYTLVSNVRQTPDLCQYTRGILRGVFWCNVIIALSVVIGLLLMELIAVPLLWLITDNGYMYFLDNRLFHAEIFFISLGIIAGGIAYSCEKAIGVVSTPKLVKTAYRGFKDKVCYMIEFD